MEIQTEKSRSQTATKLHEAALEGDISSLQNLLKEDPLILDRFIVGILSNSFIHSPIYIATSLGHLEFTKEILHQKPELAEEIDSSTKSTPLHVASKKGHLEIVKMLLAIRPNMCFARDQDGRMPIHVASMNGHVDVLHELHLKSPHATRERTNGGETVLHLCIKNSQLESLELLLDLTNNDGQLLNSKDSNGNTMLHLAVIGNQPEMVNLILEHPQSEANAINANGLTAMDINMRWGEKANEEIRHSLRRINAKEAKDLPKLKGDKNQRWIKNQSNGLMVVASLIATMAFQVGVNPPGGIWQDDEPNLKPFEHNSYNVSHFAGSSVMAYMNRSQYKNLLIANTMALFASFSVILLLISGLSCRRLFVAILTITMWISMAATSATYLISTSFLRSYHEISPKGSDAPSPAPSHTSKNDGVSRSFSPIGISYIVIVIGFIVALLGLGMGIRFLAIPMCNKLFTMAEQIWLKWCKKLFTRTQTENLSMIL